MAADIELMMQGIAKQAADLFKQFMCSAPFDGSAFGYEPQIAFSTIALYQSEVRKLRENEEQLESKLEFFGIERIQYKELTKMEADFQKLTDIWTLAVGSEEPSVSLVWKRYRALLELGRRSAVVESPVPEGGRT